MKNIQNYYLYIFIISLPIIDIVTTFTMQLPLSFGAVIRPLLMLLIIFWLLREGMRISIRRFSLIIFPFIFLIFSYIFQLTTKEPFFLIEELQFYMKTAYYVAIILFVYVYQKTSSLQMNGLLLSTQIAATITATSYWIAIGTGTSLMSYPYDKSGYSGWFFAANELSVIILILLAFTCVAYFYNQTLFSIIAFSLILSMTPMVGTKTAFFGAFIIVISAIIGGLFTIKPRRMLPMIVPVVFFIVLLPNTPAMYNTNLFQSEPNQVDEPIENTSTMNHMLSSRDVYFEDTKSEYIASPSVNKLVGLGYAGRYESHPKTIEMDFYDLFFSFGMIGTIILLYPLVLVTWQVIRSFQIKVPYMLLVGSYLLCLGVAFYVGHVIFAPAVISYVGILLLALKISSREVVKNE